jgi:hypothetical protein
MNEDDRTEKELRANREVCELARDAFALNSRKKSQVVAALSDILCAVLSDDDMLHELFNQHLARSGWQLTRIRH